MHVRNSCGSDERRAAMARSATKLAHMGLTGYRGGYAALMGGDLDKRKAFEKAEREHDGN